ncbi:7TM diverse intracellular signaling domain-containing protein [Thermoflavifilum thermophilum]|uniref:histidine kinase n=1 Tax=Thermoflavifilum thermophilum TaxID=1393122 RepID=A0A1I7MZ77_9BACT|nr:7TM diverse intracellular signaling domain-containing protein [Thermoflavifilum thermophilum]SFV27723.1 Signal transduction histidine kinase [Thermoflavifilum thermophilum]
MNVIQFNRKFFFTCGVICALHPSCIADSLQVAIYHLPTIHAIGPIDFQVCSRFAVPPAFILEQPFTTNQQTVNTWVKKYGHHVCYWIRFRLENTDSRDVEAYLLMDHFGKMVLYELLPHDTIRYAGGPGIAKSISTPPHQLQALQFKIPGHQQTTYLLQLSSSSDDDVGFDQLQISDNAFLSQSFLQQYYEDRRIRFLQLLFLGFMCSQILYVIFQWMIVKRKEYPYYFIYLSLVTLYYVHKYYMQMSIYWPFAYHPEIRFYLKSIFLMLPYFFYLKFIRNFLEIKSLNQRIESNIRLLEKMILIYVAGDMILRILFPDTEWVNDLLMVSIIIVFSCCLYFISILIKYHDPLIMLILTGSLIAGFGSLIGILISLLQVNSNVMQTNFNSLITGQIGVVIETIIFTTSLGVKTRRMEKEKLKAQEKFIQQLQENETLRKNMESIRNKIAQDLHDDIGATLSSILLYSNASMNKQSNTIEEMKNTLQKISQIARQMIDDMSDIVWAIQPMQDSMERIIQRIQYYALPLAHSKNIELKISFQEEIKQLKLDMKKRKNIYLIFKEGFTNSLKYAQATCIEIQFYIQNQLLYMTIQDNGKGFEKDDIHQGNGLNNMKSRAEECGGVLEICSALHKGTRINLQISV